jgi:hypothetical protein
MACACKLRDRICAMSDGTIKFRWQTVATTRRVVVAQEHTHTHTFPNAAANWRGYLGSPSGGVAHFPAKNHSLVEAE